jgi:RNA polymerase sigma-70 factor (ECF subfamily)
MSKCIDYLWNSIQHGDERAFDALFKELYPYLRCFAYRLLHNLPEAEEIVLDSFMNLWQNKNHIVLKGSLKSYLYQIVHNLSINRLAQFKTQRFKPNSIVNPEQWIQIHKSYEVEDSFVDIFMAKETENLIVKMIEKLPDKCREIFMLSRFENLSYIEISHKLQLSPITVRVQIFKALKFLKEFLERTNR